MITTEQLRDALHQLTHAERELNAHRAEFDAMVLRYLNQQGAGFGETFDVVTFQVVPQQKKEAKHA